MTLDAWSMKYKAVQSVRDETVEQTILRLSEKLCNNKDLLEVCRIVTCIPECLLDSDPNIPCLPKTWP